MTKFVTIHSFQGGTGKSNTTANMAAVLANKGHRVGVVDIDIQSPGLHLLFGLKNEQIESSLNDYLWGDLALKKAAIDVTANLNLKNGQVIVIPASTKPNEILQVIRDGYDAEKLSRGLRNLADDLDLDFLLMDTHPGLNEEALLSMVNSQALIVLTRPGKKDSMGTDIALNIARRLDIQQTMLVVNQIPATLDPRTVRTNFAQRHQCKVAAVLPHVDEMTTLGGEGVFALQYPDHPMTSLYQQITDEVLH